MNKEWMLTKIDMCGTMRCDGCGSNDIKGTCQKKLEGVALAAQKKLLEYLMLSRQGSTKIYHWWDFSKMLKELEEL